MVDPNPARGMPLQLQRYWLAGKGAAKIRWDTPGDFLRCVRALTKYFPKDPKGMCNILHQKATGAAPGHGPAESLLKVHHSAESMTAAANLMATQPTLGKYLWAGPLAPIGKPTGEPQIQRIFDPGALSHRSLPLPLNFRKVTAQGHQGSVTVGRIMGLTYGPGPDGDEYAWGWGDWLDPQYVPEVTEAMYLSDQGVNGPSFDPGGPVAAMVNPETGAQHMRMYTVGGATLVPIPAFTGLRLSSWENTGDNNYDDGTEDPTFGYQEGDGTASDCGCSDGDPLEPVVAATEGVPETTFTVNPPGWRGLPLAARESVFDNDNAIQRIASWAGLGTDQPDVSKMQRAFMWRNPKLPPTDPTAYRLPIGDIINGKLTLMFHAIYAAAALLSGAHGGLPDVPDNEKNQIRNEITDIYQAMAQDFHDSSIRAPWDRPMDNPQGSRFAMADNPRQPYGDVAYADPGLQADKKKRYPIDTADHVRAAWSYINKQSNASKYSPDQLKRVKDAIVAAAKKFGIDIAEPQPAMSLLEPPGAWFEDPVLPGRTAFTVEPNGRVYGHLAAWNECHRDITNKECVLAPHSKMGYRPFHLGSVRTAEGETIRVGKVVQDTRHAGINLGYMSAAIHYDNTGDEIAIVRAGEDEYGIWVAGAVVPEASPKAIAKLRRSPLSGDWRAVEGNLELTAALAVNVPAFPVYAMDGGERLALTAAGTVYPDLDEEIEADDTPINYERLTELFTEMSELMSDDDGEPEAEDTFALQEWVSDLKADHAIYEQRLRTQRLESLRAAMSPPMTGAPATAPLTAEQQAADQGNPQEQTWLAEQMNGSFGIIQNADGSPGPAATGSAPAPAVTPAGTAPAAPAPTTPPATA